MFGMHICIFAFFILWHSSTLSEQVTETSPQRLLAKLLMTEMSFWGSLMSCPFFISLNFVTTCKSDSNPFGWGGRLKFMGPSLSKLVTGQTLRSYVSSIETCVGRSFHRRSEEEIESLLFTNLAMVSFFSFCVYCELHELIRQHRVLPRQRSVRFQLKQLLVLLLLWLLL